jgi:hypothetical protein
MYYHNDRKLPLDRAFKLDEISYPANWLRLASSDAKDAVGIEWRADPSLKFKNKKFYYNTVQDGEVVSTPKDLDGLKRRMIGDANRAAHQMLSGSDWMVVRQQEAGVGLLPQWSEYRTEVRAEANRQCEQVEEATSIESLMAITANWPEDPDYVAERERRDAEIEAARLEREEND